MPITEDELRAYEDAQPQAWAAGAITRCHKTETTLQCFEVYPPGSNGTSTETISVDEAGLSSWLEQGQLSGPSPKLRVLYGTGVLNQAQITELPWTRKAFASISDRFDLSLDHLKYANGNYNTTRASSRLATVWKDRRQPKDVCTAYYLKIPIGQKTILDTFIHYEMTLFVHHRPSTNVTHALFYIDDFTAISRATGLAFNPDVIQEISTAFKTCGQHHFSPALALCSISILTMEKLLSGPRVTLSEVSRMLDLHFKEYEPDQIWKHQSISQQNRNYAKLIYSASQRIVNLLRQLNRSRAILGRLVKELEAEEKLASSPVPRSMDIISGIADQESRYDVLTSELEGMRMQIDSYSTFIYNGLAADEGRETKEIAKATLQDSSAMKSIAFLTMVFLPATAVASVLDTPFFDWDETASSLEVNGFHLFWIVSIPLTLGVIAAWFLGGLPWSEWLPLKKFIREFQKELKTRRDDKEKRGEPEKISWAEWSLALSMHTKDFRQALADRRRLQRELKTRPY